MSSADSPAEVAQDGRMVKADLQLSKLQIMFNLQADKRLIYVGAQPTVALRYLTRLVAARPRILRNHIRRVYLAIQCADNEQLTGALIDLLLVLRGRGQFLVNRLIQQSGPLLQSDYRIIMNKAVDTRDLSRLAELPLEHAVLSNGRCMQFSRQKLH
ncbi:hypothetical protein [Marinobacterium sediminicola]|uniref:Uncharacterized protein n=1 Tax=Marinobacterium sediminicola TaxID=518898 RepID=A0ABY1S2V7_9GAMM|nr:hypothetical protein [Marinobacterium sediminicola]ULG70646.1 hypothetical protein LN244_07490 [Marinobacterium sediminicola]SMR77121.1 hypothetical protein SAMN04487964_1131 [Marinobacterium sediminicola]